MDIQGAIFDMDGTLVDSLMFWGIKWKEIGAKFLNNPNFVPSEELDLSIRTMKLKECASYVRKTLNIKNSDEEVFSLLNDNILDFYKTNALLKKDVVKCLEALKKQGVKMCIASATEGDVVRQVLDYFKISDYFVDVISCTDKDVNKGKDEPDVYLKALKILGTKPSDTAVFEDSALAIETANSLGLKTVGIFDKHNDQTILKQISDIYVSEDMTIFDAIK